MAFAQRSDVAGRIDCYDLGAPVSAERIARSAPSAPLAAGLHRPVPALPGFSAPVPRCKAQARYGNDTTGVWRVARGGSRGAMSTQHLMGRAGAMPPCASELLPRLRPARPTPPRARPASEHGVPADHRPDSGQGEGPVSGGAHRQVQPEPPQNDSTTCPRRRIAAAPIPPAGRIPDACSGDPHHAFHERARP